MEFNSSSSLVSISNISSSLYKYNASPANKNIFLSISLIMASAFVGTAHAMVIPVSSMLQGEGRMNTNGNVVVTEQTDSQTSTINTLNVSDSHIATNASASTVATATWLNANQGNVSFSELDLYVGAVPNATYGQNSGFFEYEFQADTSASLNIDYGVTMQATGDVANSFLNTDLFRLDIFQGNTSLSNVIISNNTTGDLTASLIAGNTYTLAFRRYFIGSGTQSSSSNLQIDMQQTANLDWQIVPVSAVPVPAAVWLFGSGAIGLIGVARRKKV